MTIPDFNTNFWVDQTPHEVFNAVIMYADGGLKELRVVQNN